MKSCFYSPSAILLFYKQPLTSFMNKREIGHVIYQTGNMIFYFTNTIIYSMMAMTKAKVNYPDEIEVEIRVQTSDVERVVRVRLKVTVEDDEIDRDRDALRPMLLYNLLHNK